MSLATYMAASICLKGSSRLSTATSRVRWIVVEIPSRSQDAGSGVPALAPHAGDDGSAAAVDAERPRSASFLGPDLTVNGLIEARGDLRIDGHVCGDIFANRIVVGQGASIEGSIVARDVMIGGTIQRQRARRQTHARTDACVEADVSHNSLVIEQGCLLRGQVAPSGAICFGRATSSAFVDRPTRSRSILATTSIAATIREVWSMP